MHPAHDLLYGIKSFKVDKKLKVIEDIINDQKKEKTNNVRDAGKKIL